MLFCCHFFEFLWAKCLLSKNYVGYICGGQFTLDKCSPAILMLAKFLSDKCLLVNMPVTKMPVGQNFYWPKCLLAKCLLAKMSVSQNVCWPKCLLAKMSVGQNVCWSICWPKITFWWRRQCQLAKFLSMKYHLPKLLPAKILWAKWFFDRKAWQCWL